MALVSRVLSNKSNKCFFNGSLSLHRKDINYAKTILVNEINILVGQTNHFLDQNRFAMSFEATCQIRHCMLS